MIQILKSTSEFKPHLAVCHMELNGGSANDENIPLITKAVKDNENLNSTLKELGLDNDSDVIQKASYRNIQNMLHMQLKDMFSSEDDEYRYVYVEDFDENTVVFYVDDKNYSVSYSINDNGIVLVGSDYKEVVRQEVYVTAEGDSLVLKADETVDSNENPAVDAEVNKSEGLPSNINNEENMSDNKTEIDVDVEALIAKAKADTEAQVRAEIAAEQAEKELVTKAETIVKGFDFIPEDDVETLVKALVEMGDSMTTIVKALESANAKVAEIEAEKETIKKEFGEQTSIEDKPNPDKLSREDELATLVKQRKAAKAALESK